MPEPSETTPDLPVDPPPVGRYLAYRVLDLRLPPQHQGWVRADIDGDWFPLRWIAGRYAFMIGTVLSVATVAALFQGQWITTSWQPLAIGATLGLLSVPFTWHAVRRRAWRRHVELRRPAACRCVDLLVPHGGVRRRDARGGR